MRKIFLILLLTLSNQELLAKDSSSTYSGPNFQPITIGEGADEDENPSMLQRSMKSYPGYNYEAHRYHNRELRERIRLLESAVRQLQEEVYRLKGHDNSYSRRPQYTCFLNTPFNGSFYGKGDTKLEAKAKTLNECEKKDKGYCNANQVNCEKAD